MTLDLDAIADEETSKRKRSGPTCWACSLPQDVREWIVRARKEGRTYPVIIGTLHRAGLKEASKSRLLHHLTEHAE